MMRSLYTAATGMQAEDTKMDIISNNLANSNTTGFKKVQANFEDLLSETMKTPSANDGTNVGSPTGLQVGLGTQIQSTSLNLQQGTMQTTNNPLDVAIQGNGYFRVQQASGQQATSGEYAYTRAGNFQLNAQGQIVNGDGLLLEPGLTIPPQTTQITISPTGMVTATIAGRAQPQEVGQLQIATFTNPGGLTSLGGTLFQETGSSGPATMVQPGEQGTGQLLQGSLEGSNVSAVTEMIDMIAAQRGYEMNSQVIQSSDEMLKTLTSMQV